MSQVAVNDLVLSFTASLTLLLVVLLAKVIRLPSWPPLNPAARQELDTLNAQFEDDLRKDAGVRARVRGRKEISKKDIRAEFRGRRVRKEPRTLEGVTRYGGITISGAGLAIALPSLPHFPPLSHAAVKFLSGAGVILAATAMVYDGSDFLRDMVGRRRRSRNRDDQLRSTQIAIPIEYISERGEKKLRRCCERLDKDVEKEARRRAGEKEITLEDIREAWPNLVRPRALASPTIPTVRSHNALILLSLASLVKIIAVAGILYLIFSFAKAKLPTNQYWPVVTIIAALFIFYLVLVNGSRAITAAWKRRRVLAAMIGARVSGLVGSLAWLARKGWSILRSLFGDRPNTRKEDLAPAESTPDGDNGVRTDMESQDPQLPASAENRRQTTATGQVSGSYSAEVKSAADAPPFCGYDPSWVAFPLQLMGSFNKEYGGITLFGPCPRCQHEDGINVFIPTTWATASAARSPGSPVIRAAALAHPAAVSSESVDQWLTVEWQSPDAGAVGPEAERDEITEVIVCRCGTDFMHKPPSGKAGCGYWTYLRLQRGVIPDGERAG